MKGFIEITEKYIDKKVTIQVSHILYVSNDEGQAFICIASTGVKKGQIWFGYPTRESYTEVLAKIEKATK